MPITSALSPIDRADAAPAARLVGAPTRDEPSSARAAAQDFEAFVLQSFVEAMLPRDAERVFGGGTAGDIWKSMLAEQVAKELARSGGIGIAGMITQSRTDRSRAGV